MWLLGKNHAWNLKPLMMAAYRCPCPGIGNGFGLENWQIVWNTERRKNLLLTRKACRPFVWATFKTANWTLQI